MNNLIFTLKKGAVGSVMEFTLSDEDGAVSLTGKTVTVTAGAIDDAACVPAVNQTTNRGEGTFTFDITTANIAVGEYDLEFKVVSGSNTYYFPTNKNGNRTYGKLIVQNPLS